jgi:hypothetical protein
MKSPPKKSPSKSYKYRSNYMKNHYFLYLLNRGCPQVYMSYSKKMYTCGLTLTMTQLINYMCHKKY